MKTLKTVLVCIAWLIPSLLLIGCSKDSKMDDLTNPIVGTWGYTSYYQTEIYVFNADGSFENYGAAHDDGFSWHDYGTYSYQAPDLTLRYNDGEVEKCEAYIVDNQLILDGDAYSRQQ